MGRHGGGMRSARSGGRSRMGGGSRHRSHRSHFRSGRSSGSADCDCPTWWLPWRRPRLYLGGCCCFIPIVFLTVILSLSPSSEKGNVDLTSSETVLLRPGTTWHSGVELTTAAQAHTEAYLFKDVPPLSETIAKKKENHTLSIPRGSYEYWAFRLTPGSNITVYFQTNFILQFLIMSGENFNEWDNGYSVPTYKEIETRRLNFTFTAPYDGDFYFIWYNEFFDKRSGGVSFDLSLKTYDLSNPMDKCDQKFPCTLPLDRGSSQCVVIAGLDSNIPNDVFSVSYTIKPRSSYYWGILGSIFAVLMAIGIIVPVVLYLTFRRKSSRDPQTQPILPTTTPTVSPTYTPPPSTNPSYSTPSNPTSPIPPPYSS